MRAVHISHCILRRSRKRPCASMAANLFSDRADWDSQKRANRGPCPAVPIDLALLFPPFTATYQKTLPKAQSPHAKVRLMLELATPTHPESTHPLQIKHLTANWVRSLNFSSTPKPSPLVSVRTTSQTTQFLPLYRHENKSHNPKSVSFLIFADSAPKTPTETGHPPALQNRPAPLHCPKGSYKILKSRVEPLPFVASCNTSRGPESVR